MLTNQADWRCLLVRLESDGFDTSMRRWSLLVATLAHCQPDEHTAVAWHRLLAPVLCRNASEQVRLLPHLQAWLTLEAKSQSAKYIVESAQTTKLPPPLQPKLSRIMFFIFLCVLLLLTGMQLQPKDCPVWLSKVGLCSALPDSTRATITGIEITPDAAVITSTTYPEAEDPIALQQGVDAPDLLVSYSTEMMSIFHWGLSALPLGLLLLLYYLAWRHRKQLADWQQDHDQAPGHQLDFQGARSGAMDQPQMGRDLRRLRDPVRLSSINDIDWPSSVERTLQRGLMTLVRQGRKVVPGVVVLVSVRQYFDWNHELGMLIRDRLNRAGFAHVPSYRFQGIPQTLYPLDSHDAHLKPLALADFARRYGDHRTLVLADGFTLIDRSNWQPLSWLKSLQTAVPPLILSTTALPYQSVESFFDVGIELAAFGDQGLRKNNINDLLELPFWPLLDQHDQFITADDWATLKTYFSDSWYLFQVACIYPEFHLDLVLALDQRIFPQDLGRCMQRVMRLGVTPWARRGWVPDEVRQYSIASMNRFELKVAMEAYDKIFVKSANLANEGHRLQVRIDHEPRWLALLQGRYRPLPTNAVFLSWAMGGWRRKLAFMFPRLMINTVTWQRSVTLSLLLLTTLGGVLGLGLWQQVPHWLPANDVINGATIRYTARQQPLAVSLARVLKASGVSVQAQQIANSRLLQVYYPMTAESVVEQLVDHIGALNWGAGITQTADRDLDGHLLFELGEPINMPEHNGFRDPVKALDAAQIANFLLSVAQPTPVENDYQPKQNFKSHIAPAMQRLKGGDFVMGSDGGDNDEKPTHKVTIAPFWLMVNEVTFAEYALFAADTKQTLPGDSGWGRDNRPVINVSWDNATAYADWLSSKTGQNYRLPSESEWEYAARAGTTTAFSFGNCIHTNQANHNGNFRYQDCEKTGVYRQKTVAVDELSAANLWGLRHMHGNVWEWTQDCWHTDYVQAPVDGQPWLNAYAGDCSRRVLRGGSWFAKPSSLRSANRNRSAIDARFDSVGFRLARDD